MKRSHLLALAGVTLAVAGAAWWLLADGSASGPGAGPRDGTTKTDGAEKAARSVIDPTLAPIAATGYRGEGERPEAQHLYVLVVDEKDAPVADAAVELHRARANGRGRGPQGFNFGDPSDDVPHRPTRSQQTDRDGIADFVDWPKRQIEILAHSETRVGSADFDPQDWIDRTTAAAPFKLVIKPIKTLDVRVVDGTGSPVPGVRVLASLDEGNRGWNTSRNRAWTTDPEGRAQLRLTALDGATYDANEVFVVASLGGNEPTSEKVKVAEAITPVTLHVPVVVGVRVTVKVESGDKLPDDLSLRWTIDTTAAGGGGGNPFGNGLFGRRDFSEATTVVGGLKPGAKITFTLAVDGRLNTTKDLTLPVDTSMTTLEIPLGKRQPYITAKLVDERTAPITEGAYAYEFTYADEAKVDSPAPPDGGAGRRGRGRFGAQNTLSVDPDENGFVKFSVDADRAGTLRFLGDESTAWARGQDDKPIAERKFDAIPAGQTAPVADIVFSRAPLIVAGHVKTPEGKPVPRARVSLTPTDGVFGGRRNGGNNGGGQGPPEADLMALFQATTRTGATGAFEVRARVKDTSKATGFKVAAQLRGGRAEAIAFAAGATDVDLTLVATGGIAGVARLGSPLLTRPLSVEATDRSANTNAGGFRGPGRFNANRDRVDPTGAFKLEDVAAGHYDVLFRYGQQDALTITDIEVKSGEISKDPRLQNVVIGADALEAVVVVQTPDGKPFAGASVQFQTDTQTGAGGRGNNGGGRGNGPGGGRGGFNRNDVTTNAQGRASDIFVERPQTLNVRVTARGYLDASFQDPPFPLIVKLDPGASLVVTLDLAGGLPTIEGVSEYRIRVSPAPIAAEAGGDTTQLDMNALGGGGGGFAGQGKTATIAPGGTTATVTGLEPGKYTVSLRATLRTGPGGNGGFGPGGFGGGPMIELGKAEIPTGAHEQRLTVKINDDLLTKIKGATPVTRPPNGGQGGNRRRGG